MVFPETTQIPPVPLIINLTGLVDTTPVKLIGGSKKAITFKRFSNRLNVMAFLPAGCYAPSILAFVTTKTLTSQVNLRTKVQRFGAKFARPSTACRYASFANPPWLVLVCLFTTQ